MVWLSLDGLVVLVVLVVLEVLEVLEELEVLEVSDFGIGELRRRRTRIDHGVDPWNRDGVDRRYGDCRWSLNGRRLDGRRLGGRCDRVWRIRRHRRGAFGDGDNGAQCDFGAAIEDEHRPRRGEPRGEHSAGFMCCSIACRHHFANHVGSHSGLRK